MSTHSLSDVLNDLAGGRAAALARDIVPVSSVTEESLFIGQDAVLASLNREYLNSRAYHDAARREHGADSPMTDIAADALDSAWCAMQTRLMELRADGGLMRLVQTKLRDAAREAERAQREAQDRGALSLFNRMEAARIAKAHDKSSPVYDWLLVFMIFHHTLRLPFPALGIPERRMAA